MAGPAARPPLTVAVIHHHLRGYPEECLAPLVASAPPETEFLLVHGTASPPVARALDRFPQVRAVPLEQGDRAGAKNLAVGQARGELLLLTSSDCVAREGAVEPLRRFVLDRPTPTVASAQILLENGTRRVTGFRLPSLGRECNVLRSLGRVRRLFHRYGRPAAGPIYRVPALHATFILARRETFEQAGPFAAGYRFAAEDLEWSWRARQQGAELYVAPESRVFYLPPQLVGPLPPAERVAMEAAYARLAESLHGPLYGRCYRGVRQSKALIKWLTAAALQGVLCGRSYLLGHAAAANRAVWRTPLDGRAGAALPPDAESHVRWELTL